ncbi:MAG: asparaginase [Pseudomonadota bacterium]|jgi:L-asparaginase|nr:asparaginase [Pseudomonadota bacterium]MEC8138362.1 asparaginase [Pseudomonadota bacterium]MEC8173947.1 asparaginase [Pseudomonadota bacterium]MEC8700554.1 asparaginase [Pseudomonadota bacterium]MED5359567.1 asparaginase [Pseudomonadota bacterium]
MPSPRVAVIGTGGTISSVGKHSLDLVAYVENNKIYEVDELLNAFPETLEQGDVVPVRLRAMPSTAIGPAEWLEINTKIHDLVEEDPSLDGIVVTHGTATLEETAYFLNLASKVDIPIVLVGAQRPASGMGTDSGINLVNAIRTAGHPDSRGRGVLGVLNDEIHFSRDMTKTSTLRQQTFKSPDFGLLGHADWDKIAYYRMPERRRAPNTEFDVRGLTELPRVDISMTYAGTHGTAIDAYVAAGAKGIVVGAMAPGYVAPIEFEKLAAAAEKGVTIVHSTRAGSGRVADVASRRVPGTVLADNLPPQKARVLLTVALTKTDDPAELQRIFDEY